MKKIISVLVLFVCFFSFELTYADFTGSIRPPMPIGSDGFTHYMSASGIEYVYFFNTQNDYQYFVDQGHAGALHVFANNYGPALWYFHVEKIYERVSENWEEQTLSFYPNDVYHMLDSNKTLHEQICSTTDLRAGYNQYFPGYYGFSTNPAYAEVVMTANCVVDPIETPLHFPLKTLCSGITCTPYTAPVSSVMDQSTVRGIVVAFNGETGDVRNGCWCYDTNSACNSNNYTSCFAVGFAKSSTENKYFFEDATGTKIINYPGSPGGHNDIYLYYDKHAGYDYPGVFNKTKVFAPANGTLCVATAKTSKPATTNVWRNPTYCPLPKAGGTTWESYHTLYIIHKGLRINGSVNDYMTVFLHNNALSSAARTKIEQFGYVKVFTGSFIALVGKYSPNKIGPHMHLEVYKKNGAQWDRVDPYGDSIHNILWKR